MIVFSTILAIAFGFAAFFFLRLYPMWPNRTRGCDAYNILLCAEDIRRERHIPARLPGLFLLEEPQQWYPPLFLLIAALFPRRWLEQRFWLLNQIVDLGSAMLLFGFVTWNSSPWLAACAVIAYGMMAGLVQEFSVLNTRPLGLLVINMLLLAAFLASQDGRWLPLVLLCGVILIYAHKLSAQQLWFSAPVLAVVTWDWHWLLLVPAIYAAAFLIWPRGFQKIIAGHVAIVKFWNREWPLLGAHAVRQSPIYGDGQTRLDFYHAWPGGSPVKFAKETLHQNYFVVPAAIAIFLAAPGDPFVTFLAGWIVSVYVAASVIHFIPQLRGIGLGRQYVKFALLPSLMATVPAVHANASIWLLAATAIATALTIRQYWLVAQGMRADTNAASLRTAELERLLGTIATDSNARVMVLPVHLCDLVAYATRRPVYWGTHAQVFDERLNEFFPVLRRPIADYVKDGDLNRLLLDTRYAALEELGIDASSVVETSGNYVLVALNNASSSEAAFAGATAS